VQRTMPTTVYGLTIHAYGRFRLRELFMEFADGARRPAPSSCAITLLPLGELDGSEIVVTRMLRRRTDAAIVMRYLRQWILSEPGRILHMIEDRNRLRRRVESHALEGTYTDAAARWENAVDAQISAEQLVADIEHFQQEDRRQYLAVCPALDGQIFEIDISNINMHRWLHSQVLGAYHELTMAHPEIVVDPAENLSIQDPELEQILRERNQREQATRASNESKQHERE
jgi:hypothetical protein